MAIDLNRVENLSCGCRMVLTIFEGERTLAMRPCSFSCENYRYALNLTASEGKPIQHKSGQLDADGKIHLDPEST